MQYLVEAKHGPLPGSAEEAVEMLEGTVIPHFDYMIRLKAEERYWPAACRSAIEPSWGS